MVEKRFYAAARRFPKLWAKLEHTAAKAQGKSDRDANFLLALMGDVLMHSRAQHHQDVIAAYAHGFKRGGFFVEFGAGDGTTFSNTHLLENLFGWRGILSEPARARHADLARTRSAHIDQRCVWSCTGQTLIFRETEVTDLSTIDQFSSGDRWGPSRHSAVSYPVESVSLLDLLAHHGAPHVIDFLSVDTEGSEWEILNAFDFTTYDVRLICCEHNFTPQREKLHALLVGRGYARAYERVSAVDDWYVKRQ